jgi:uncharacterized protein YndB with AHSA1/START domain
MAKVTEEIFVLAPVKTAYRAFTNSTALREWLSDVATVEPHVNGRIYLWWRGDFYSSGHYLELDENKRIRFRWFGNNDSAPTEVTVSFSEKEAGTLIHLEHEVPDDPSWTQTIASLRENWAETLRNLKSILETGVDLRIAERPMLGILPGNFTDEQAKALGVPVHEGMRLDGVVDGLGAQRSGLQKDDVIVEMAGHPIRSDANSLPAALAGKKGGEHVSVVIYRGPEKKNIDLELSRRPMPEVPFDAKELANRARTLYEAGLAEVEICFESVTDEQAMAKAGPKEWSALEIIAHLIHNERFNHTYLTGLIDGFEPVTDGFGDNVDAQVAATVKANPSVALMLSALRRTVEETLAYVSMVPDEFIANKGSYYRFGFGLLQPNFHLTGHTEQIKAALAAASK